MGKLGNVAYNIGTSLNQEDINTHRQSITPTAQTLQGLSTNEQLAHYTNNQALLDENKEQLEGEKESGDGIWSDVAYYCTGTNFTNCGDATDRALQRQAKALYPNNQKVQQEYVAGRMLGFGNSIVKVATDTANMVVHPVDTATNAFKGLANAISSPVATAQQQIQAVEKWQQDYKNALKYNPKLAGQMYGELEGAVGANIATAVIGGTATNAVKALHKTGKFSASKPVKILSNDPSILPTVKVTTSGNISAIQATTNGKIVSLPQTAIKEQEKLKSPLSNNASGEIRETISNLYFANNGFKPLDGHCHSQCFDGVYEKNGEIYIVEVKPYNGGVKLSPENPKTDLPAQMTDSWIFNRTNELEKMSNPNKKATATKILDAYYKGKPVNKIVMAIDGSRAIMINLGQVKKP